jgi:hypothetical protein
LFLLLLLHFANCKKNSVSTFSPFLIVFFVVVDVVDVVDVDVVAVVDVVVVDPKCFRVATIATSDASYLKS